MQEVLIGQADYTVVVDIQDDAGAPATGLTESSIDIAYVRVETDNDVVSTDVTPAALTALTDAHTDWGFEEVSSTDHPGLYRLDIADAVFASGAWSAVVTITGTGLHPCKREFVLVVNDAKAANPPANYINAAALAADVTTEIQSGLATAAALDAVDNFVDTEIGTIVTAVAAIQAKTDNLPSDPADASVVAGLIAAVETKVDTVDTVVDAIKAKTDNLPSDPADQSAVEAKIDAQTVILRPRKV